MNGLVGYGSSDEEEEIQERPTKVAKTDANRGAQAQLSHEALPDINQAPQPVQSHDRLDEISRPRNEGPAPEAASSAASPIGPQAAPIPTDQQGPSATSSPPRSPYTTTRNLLHSLTMPTVPNFDIPPSPPPSQLPDVRTSLAASTKKFTRFLDLKRKGVHFNARLNSSSSLRNPSLLPKLMEYAGVSEEDSRMSTLSEEAGAVPVVWQEDVESLVRENERWRKRRAKGREKVEFVGAKSGVEGM